MATTKNDSYWVLVYEWDGLRKTVEFNHKKEMLDFREKHEVNLSYRHISSYVVNEEEG